MTIGCPGGGEAAGGRGGLLPPDHDPGAQEAGVPLGSLVRQEAGPAQQVELQHVQQHRPGDGGQLVRHQHPPHLQQEVSELLRLAPLDLLAYDLHHQHNIKDCHIRPDCDV